MKNFLTSLVLLLASVCMAQSDPHFKKIIYHTTGCFGTCPAYSLEISKDKSVKLIILRAFKKGEGMKQDSARMGSYTGKLTSEQYRQLLEEIKAADIDHLQFPDVLCCDGPVVTLIVYNSKGRKYFKSMTPPQEARNLLNYLFGLCENGSFKKTAKKLRIEQ